MNLPLSTSDSSDAATSSPEICDGCGSRDSWVLLPSRYRCIVRFFCTHCLLREHPTSFCPSCFAFYDSSPPHHSRRVSCSDCGSYTHIHCAGDANSSPYRCPPCRDPDSFSFFSPFIDAAAEFAASINSRAFLCAAKIAASSMNKAVNAFKCDAERRGKEAAVARKRAREAMEDVMKLDKQAKSDAQKVSVELYPNRDQKPNMSPAASANSVQLKKQNPSVQLAKVKHER